MTFWVFHKYLKSSAAESYRSRVPPPLGKINATMAPSVSECWKLWSNTLSFTWLAIPPGKSLHGKSSPSSYTLFTAVLITQVTSITDWVQNVSSHLIFPSPKLCWEFSFPHVKWYPSSLLSEQFFSWWYLMRSTSFRYLSRCGSARLRQFSIIKQTSRRFFLFFFFANILCHIN